MSDHLEKTIAALQQKIEHFEREANKVKAAINQLLDLEGRPPMYADADLHSSSNPTFTTRPDEFFNQPLATSVKKILERRQAMNLGAASVDEIYSALIAGGYDPGQKNESIAKRNVAISLSKNLSFIRTPNDRWGLREWYGMSTKRQRENSSSALNQDIAEDMSQTELEEVENEPPPAEEQP